MRAAAAFQARQALADLGVRGLRVLLQQGSRRHDPAIDAIAALRGLLGDPGGLQRMWLLDRAETGQRRDLGLADRRDRRDAGAHRLAIDMHRAGAALAEAATEMRIGEA